MRNNTPFGSDKPEQPEQPPLIPKDPALYTKEQMEKMKLACMSLHRILRVLWDGMEANNDGQKLTDREKAMIGHAFFVGATTLIKVTTFDTSNGPPSTDEVQARGLLLKQYKEESDAMMKVTHDRNNGRN